MAFSVSGKKKTLPVWAGRREFFKKRTIDPTRDEAGQS
jgi:hypothetical protein